MSEVDNTRRLLADDFDEEIRPSIEKIAELYNFSIEQITNVLNGDIDYSNLAKDLIQIEVIVDANGIPATGNNFTAAENMTGSSILRAVNLTNFSNFVTAAPFMTFTRVQGVTYKIDHIVGLRPGERYLLTIELSPSI